MPWHELKALHRENIEAESNKRSKKHRRKLLGKLSTDLDYLEGTSKAESFYCVKYGSSIITSKIPSKILSNENKKTGVSRKIVCFGILIHVLS